MRTIIRAFLVVAAAVALILPAAADEPQSRPSGKDEVKAGTPGEKVKEPDYIRVQHILIGFKGSAKPTNALRTPDEARTLAKEILKRAQSGEDFDALAKQYSDDRPPGIYTMSNDGVPPRQQPPAEFQRRQMVPAFGNVGFSLQVGEIGMSEYDPKDSPFGYHIIKRLD